jgi:hypothetical protein
MVCPLTARVAKVATKSRFDPDPTVNEMVIVVPVVLSCVSLLSNAIAIAFPSLRNHYK